MSHKKGYGQGSYKRRLEGLQKGATASGMETDPIAKGLKKLFGSDDDDKEKTSN